MKFEKYNKIVLCACFIFIFVISSINYLADPFAVFGVQHYFNEDKPHVDKNQRISKVPELKLYKYKLDAIWLGSSRTGWNTNEKYEKSILHANIKNMALNSCTLEEAIAMAENAVYLHPEIKTIYLGIDFSMFDKANRSKETLAKIENKKVTKEEILPLIFSFDTLEHSFVTLFSNFKFKKEAYGEEIQYQDRIFVKFKNTLHNYYNNSYVNYKLDYKKINDLKKFIKWANSKNINVIIFAPTMHISERIAINNAKKTDVLYQYKEELAKIQSYYDFAVIDKYTTDVIHPEMQYFRDAIHTYSFLRKKISRKLFGYEEDFGQLITKDNVKRLNQEDKKQLDKYIEQNPELVSQVKEWCQ